MRRGRSSVSDFFANFNQAYGTVNNVAKDVELSRVAGAKAEESTGFTAEQGQQLESLAKQGFDNITYDDQAKAYVAKNATGASKSVAMQGVTDFMGNRTAGGQDSARMQAMAGVLTKYDPEQGMRMQRELKRDERDDKRWQREEKKATDDEEFETGLRAEYGQSIFAKRMGEFAPQMQAYEQADKQYKERMQAGESPQSLGIPPTAPQRPAYSMAESLADSGRLLAYKATKGKADPAEIMRYAENFKKVTDEGYGQALKLAQGGAPLAKVAEQFNQMGGTKFDPAAVVSDEMVKGPDGVASRVIKFKDPSGKVQTINALSELDSIGQAEGYFSRFYKSEDNRRANSADGRGEAQLQLSKNADGRAAAADGRAAASHAATVADRAELRSVREALATDAGMTPTQVRGVRVGVLATPGADDAKEKYNANPVMVQKAFGETLVDPLTGKESIKRDPEEEKRFNEFMADRKIRDVEKGLVLYNQTKVQGERKAKAENDQRRAKVSASMTQENLEATAKKYNMSVAQVVKELEKQGIKR